MNNMKRMEKVSIGFALAAILGMTSVTGITSAQQDRNSNSNQNSNSNTNNNRKNGKDNMNSNMAMNSNMSGGATLNASDTDFANMAAMGGEAEIQMAQLAIQRSKNKGVVKYAQKMVKDHTKAGKELDKVATQKSMTLTKTPSADQMEMMNQLRQASDADFDMTYIRVSGVQAHQAMETLYQSEASGGSDPKLKGFAAKNLPVVQMHLRMAQEMASGGMTNSNTNMKSNMNMNSNTNSNTNSNR
jgi:putative membrane protein